MSEILYKALSYALTGAIYEVSHVLGPGLLEKCYQEALEIELEVRGLPFEREKSFDLFYKDKLLNAKYIADFVVDNKIIVELKSVSDILPEHRAQLINYLRISGLKLGLLVNFKNRKVDIERLTNFSE
ncbi:MAG: GxxExxY protein [Bacteroidaceae bacterium]|nr:GxxExxY protein [Bacteroidaceae bacterium]